MNCISRCALSDNTDPGDYVVSQLFARFWKDQSAATAIEYGLIAAGISVAVITVVKGIGTKLDTTFGSISTQLK